MLPSERHAIILREVSRHPAVSIRALTEKLGVSRETVRKDIEQLALENKLNQVRGGATGIRTQEPPMVDRAQTNPEGKARIGAQIAGMIPDGASIIIDNGSTTRAAAVEIAKAHNDLTIYTNDLAVASIVSPAAKDVIVLGGRLDVAENATIGLDTLDHLSRYHAQFALVGVGGFSARAGFTDFSLEAANLRHLMVQRAEKPVLLADKTKLNVVGKVALKPWSGPLKLVTDARIPADISAFLERHSILATLV